MHRTLRHLFSVAALVAALAALGGCSSDSGSAGIACVEHSECSDRQRGTFCTLEGVCGDKDCTTAGDCSQGLVCLVDIGKCGPRECGGDDGLQCPAGTTCDRGTCVADNTPQPDVVGGDAVDPDVKEPPADVLPDVPTPINVAACTACTADANCGEGKTCEQLGATKNCVAGCADDADCSAGWVCYPLTNEGNACVPAAFSCAAPCLAAGCPAGQVCDQIEGSGTFGQCVAGLAECDACENDWECGAGYRCGQSAGGLRFCLRECADGNCPAWAACTEKGGLGGAGVMFCRPIHPTCCGAGCAVEQCNPACSGSTPVCHNGQCVQCDSDDDCPNAGQTCNPLTYQCQGGPCPDPSMPYAYNGSCVQCLQDSHCGATGSCNQATHTCAGGDACGGACVQPYPGCAVINGVPSCVPCTSDVHCPGGTCNTTTYSCVGGTAGGGCAGDCLIAGCSSVSGQFNLACDPESGCCYDSTGLCDNVEAFCNTSSGSECKSIFEIFMGGAIPGGGLPGMEGAFVGGMCTCDAAFGAICGFMPGNPLCANVPTCYGGVSCMPIGTAMQLLMQLGGGGGGGALLFSGDVCMKLGK